MTTEQHKLEVAQAELARLTGRTVEEIAAMSREELMDRAARTALHTLAMKTTTDHIDHLVDDGPREQTERATAALVRFHEHTPLWPVHDAYVDLAGFGEAPIHFIAYDVTGQTTGSYLLLSEVAEALAVPLHRAHEWARRDHLDAIRAQREQDEERGDGRLGWDSLRDLVDMELHLVVDDPDATPDAGGHRWSFAGDWLISQDRLLAFMTISPWSKEFMSNAMPAFGHAMRKTWGDKLKDIPTYDGEGNPTGGNAFEDLFRTDGLTEEEARERARRGPAGPLQD